MAEKNINILDELDELKKKGMLSKRIVILKGPVQDGLPAIEKSEESIIDEEGFKETAISELFYAPGCNHLIHTEEELGAICAVCSHLLCRACSTTNICSLCGKIVCKKDQKQIEDIGMVCSPCKNEWIVKKVISFLITAGIAGAIIFFVLRFVQ